MRNEPLRNYDTLIARYNLKAFKKLSLEEKPPASATSVTLNSYLYIYELAAFSIRLRDIESLKV